MLVQPPFRVRKRYACWLLETRHSTSTGVWCRNLQRAAGMMAHADFEFLADRVKAAKEFMLKTLQQLNEHTEKHGC
jgi:hypothetical protein